MDGWMVVVLLGYVAKSRWSQDPGQEDKDPLFDPSFCSLLGLATVLTSYYLEFWLII